MQVDEGQLRLIEVVVVVVPFFFVVRMVACACKFYLRNLYGINIFCCFFF